MRNKLLLAGMFLALVFLGFLLASAWVKRQALVNQLSSLERDSSSLSQENESLEKVISDIGSDVVKELEVRRKLNYSKPGEVLVVFISPSPVPSPAAQQTWLERIKNFLKR